MLFEKILDFFLKLGRGSAVWLLNSKDLEHFLFAFHPTIIPAPLLIKLQVQFDHLTSLFSL